MAGSDGDAAPQPASAKLEETRASNDATLVASWGVSLTCVGLVSDARPPVCADKTGCYTLELMDLAVKAISVRANGLSLEAAQSYYDSVRNLTLGADDVKACFAFELERGRPPTGFVRVRLDGEAGECAEATIIERSVGQKTADCVRDTLKRFVLPPGSGKQHIELESSVEGL